MDFNPYYEERLANMNRLLQKIQDENKDVEKQNQDLAEELKNLELEIENSYKSICSLIEPLKNKA